MGRSGSRRCGSLKGNKKITTIYLREDQLEWLKENCHSSISRFIEQLIDREIKTESSIEAQIERLRAEIEALGHELELKKKTLAGLIAKSEEQKRASEISEAKDLIMSALQNIKYDSWEDAASDLDDARGSIEAEEWRKLVKEAWDGLSKAAG